MIISRTSARPVLASRTPTCRPQEGRFATALRHCEKGNHLTAIQAWEHIASTCHTTQLFAKSIAEGIDILTLKEKAPFPKAFEVLDFARTLLPGWDIAPVAMEAAKLWAQSDGPTLDATPRMRDINIAVQFWTYAMKASRKKATVLITLYDTANKFALARGVSQTKDIKATIAIWTLVNSLDETTWNAIRTAPEEDLLKAAENQRQGRTMFFKQIANTLVKLVTPHVQSDIDIVSGIEVIRYFKSVSENKDRVLEKVLKLANSLTGGDYETLHYVDVEAACQLWTVAARLFPVDSEQEKTFQSMCQLGSRDLRETSLFSPADRLRVLNKILELFPVKRVTHLRQ